MTSVKIIPEKNVIDDGFLDLIGREFVTHEKGLAEWLKNAADAILAAGLTSGSETIFLHFTDQRRGKSLVFECIDFVGMTLEEIERAFKPWGRLSWSDKSRGTYGGYGIGGKFYMRQMFASSYLITFSQGLLSVFGFDQNHAYGYAQGHKNQSMDPQEALSFAGIEPFADLAGVKEALVKGKRGFSVVRGIGPRGVGRPIDVESLCGRLRNDPQAQGPLKSHRVCVMHNTMVVLERLRPRSIPRKPGFERPWVRRIPSVIPPVNPEGGIVRRSQDAKSAGALRLFVSSESLIQRGKMASLNRIDFLGSDGIIASYRLDELGVDVPWGEFIFGECILSRLDHSKEHSGKKTRDRLIDSPESRALLRWVGAQVTDFSRMIQSKASEQ